MTQNWVASIARIRIFVPILQERFRIRTDQALPGGRPLLAPYSQVFCCEEQESS